MVVHPAVGLDPPPRQMWKKMAEPAYGLALGGGLWAMKSLSEIVLFHLLGFFPGGFRGVREDEVLVVVRRF